jgi:hypothetical protein
MELAGRLFKLIPRPVPLMEAWVAVEVSLLRAPKICSSKAL